MKRRFPPPRVGNGLSLRETAQVILDGFPGSEMLVQMGMEAPGVPLYVTSDEFTERVMELAEVGAVAAIRMTDELGSSRRLFLIRCGGCGDVFFRSSGPGGYGGTSTWKGRCPNGCRVVKDSEWDKWIGELT